uniref:Uncharacterized protein n=1 Tax=Arundo donax TaxID=35708 RepID=A0A0A9AUS8_ARUDO
MHIFRGSLGYVMHFMWVVINAYILFTIGIITHITPSLVLL